MSEVKITDGGEQTIKCSDCNFDLMHYRIYADADIYAKIKATCPFCNGSSFIHDIRGLFMIGPIGQKENSIPTVISEIDEGEDITVFTIIKRG